MKIQAIDTHCHLQFPQYDTDRDAVIKRARGAGIGTICVGTDLETSRHAVQLAQQNDDMWASVGLHPNDVAKGKYDEKDYESLLHDPKIVALGEIGLDYYRQTDEAKQDLQEEIFRRQLALAGNLPCIIHCRDPHRRSEGEASAHKRMIEILQEHKTAHGVIHSFNGTREEPDVYIEEGWYIGLNGIITFSTEYGDMVRHLPVESILLETDAPYLSPVPYRGQRNEPLQIMDIATWIAVIKGITLEDLKARTLANTLQCFGGISIAA